MSYQDGTVDCTRCPHGLEIHTQPGGCRECRCVVRYSVAEVQTLRRNIGLPPQFEIEED